LQRREIGRSFVKYEVSAKPITTIGFRDSIAVEAVGRTIFGLLSDQFREKQ
jgi:hypothetical protein